jgi:transcriptional regulator with XRE-family HTH domain
MKAENGFGKRVTLVRREAQLSMSAFAKKALSPNASAKNIGRIENEEVTPRTKTLAKIADVGGVDMKWLATGQCDLKPGTIVRTAGVGERIAQARRAKGMSCLALAQASGLGASPKNISRLEKGEHRPRSATLERIAASLKVPVAYLAYGN